MTELGHSLPVRLIATDVDGTLLNPRKRVSVKTREAFQRVQAGGATIALMSSRMPASLRVVEHDLGVDCWKVAYDGAVLARPGGSGQEEEITGGIAWQDVRLLLDSIKVEFVGVYAADVWVSNERGRWSEREAATTGVHPQFYENIESATNWLAAVGPIYKIMFRDEAHVLSQAKEALRNLGLTNIRWFSNGQTIVEVAPAQASKSAGLRALLDRIGVDPTEVLAFGDGHNDLSVFELISNSVAVENAVPELKVRARHITGRGDDDGVARYLALYIP